MPEDTRITAQQVERIVEAVTTLTRLLKELVPPSDDTIYGHCPSCDTDFIRKRKWQEFCSPACQKTWNNRKRTGAGRAITLMNEMFVTKRCPACKNEFQVERELADVDEMRYCPKDRPLYLAGKMGESIVRETDMTEKDNNENPNS